MANKILATSQVTIVDLNDQVSLSSHIDCTVPQMQLISNTNVYLPTWTPTSPVELTTNLFKIGFSSQSIINQAEVKAVRWKYKLSANGNTPDSGESNGFTTITSSTPGFQLVGDGPKHSSIKIINNVMSKNHPGLVIRCEMDYQEEWMPYPHTQVSELPFTLSAQGDNGADGADAYIASLTNENQSIACDSDGNPLSGQIGSTGKAKTTIQAFKGITPLTAVDTTAQLGAGKFTVAVKTIDGTATLKRVSGSFDTYYLEGPLSDSGSHELTISFESSGISTQRLYTYTKTKAGANTVIATLTNESQSIATKPDGSGGDFSICKSAIQLYSGSALITQGVSYAIDSKSDSVSATMSSAGEVSVSGMTTDTGYVDLKATYKTVDYVRRFTISKAKAGSGQNATSYWMICPAAVSQNSSGEFIPTSIDLTAMSQTGESTAQLYLGKFVIEKSNDGTAWTKVYSSSVNESSVKYTIPAADKSAKMFKAYLHPKDSTVTLAETKATPTVLDYQTIMVTKDGQDGTAAKVLDIAGQNQFRVSATGTVTPSTIQLSASTQGVTNPSIQWQTSVNDVWTNLATGNSVNVTPSTNGWKDNILRVKAYVVGQESVYDTFSLIKTTDGTNGSNGANAINFTIYAPKGSVIHNNNASSITVNSMMFEGSNEITNDSEVSYKWIGMYPSPTGEKVLKTGTGSAGSSLVVSQEEIPNMLVVRCEATYKTKVYKSTITLEDKNDPIQAEAISLNGEVFKNGIGETYLYAKLIQNGVELDKVDLHDSVPATTGYKEGDVIFVKSDKKYRKLVSNAWQVLSAAPETPFTYTWSKYRSNGTLETTIGGKIVHVTSNQVDEKANFMVNVEG